MSFHLLYSDIVSSEEFKGHKFPIEGFEPGGDFLNVDLYHRFLALFVSKTQPKRVLELGRRFGNSLYSLSYYLPNSSILDSYDIINCGNVINKPNVNILVYDGNIYNLNFFLYDFIFVDVNGYGKVEAQIYCNLIEKSFKGIVAWDDVGSMWCPDKDFWDNIEIEKMKAPLHGDYFGFTIHK